jgi:enoyl-[acyl-carrier protein] reductase II
VLHTTICDLLNIRYPIIQGGMAWVATAELAAAVSNGGGLGIIGAGNAPSEFVRQQIRKAKTLTDKPFGVNVMLMSPYADDVVKVICEEKVPVVTTGAGNPAKYISDLKSTGCKVIPVIPSVALAKRMEKVGADALVAEGHESGGHIGELTTMVLIPQVVDVVNIPVIAAGGIADGRGMAAALALGAQGVQMGTRFVCSTECTAHEHYKEAIVNAGDRDAVVTGRPTGHPVRVLKNKLTAQYDKLEQEHASTDELEALGTGRLKAAVVDGDAEYGSIMAGQIAGLINDIKPAAAIIQDVISQAADIISRMQGLLDK